MRWTDEQRALRQTAEEIGDLLSAGHLERDAAAAFHRDGWKHLCASGLLGLPFPTRWGGLGQDLLTTMYALEGFGRTCRDGGLGFSAVTHIVSTGVPLQRFGSAELKQRYLPSVCAGATIGAHAITEPEGGSDVLRMRTTAVPEGDGFRLTGRKAFVSNGPIADVFVVYARTGSAGNPAGLTVFLIERGAAGLTTGPSVDKMGLRTSPLGIVDLDGVWVPKAQVIGSVGGGFLVLDHVMRWEILCSFALTTGEMAHRLDECVGYARSRIQFGANIGSHQSIANKIVDMRIDLETSRGWLYSTAEKLMEGADVVVDVAITKLIVSEGNVRSALAAIQTFGGNGYLTEFGLEKALRNAVAGTIYSGTSEIQRQRIAALMGLHRPVPAPEPKEA
jgi:alkylation response protein AidB-like acyl-CoA dehydrogenase